MSPQPVPRESTRARIRKAVEAAIRLVPEDEGQALRAILQPPPGIKREHLIYTLANSPSTSAAVTRAARLNPALDELLNTIFDSDADLSRMRDAIVDATSHAPAAIRRQPPRPPTHDDVSDAQALITAAIGRLEHPRSEPDIRDAVESVLKTDDSRHQSILTALKLDPFTASALKRRLDDNSDLMSTVLTDWKDTALLAILDYANQLRLQAEATIDSLIAESAGMSSPTPKDRDNALYTLSGFVPADMQTCKQVLMHNTKLAENLLTHLRKADVLDEASLGIYPALNSIVRAAEASVRLAPEHGAALSP